MSTLPTVDDLRLVDAIATNGSLGLAAAALQITQPSASQRLATLERRLGVVLFERGPRGARPTRAGLSLAGHARRVLELMARAVADARSAATGDQLVAGTIPSLAPTVFAALDALLPDRRLAQRTDHGSALVAAVADGAVDLAVVAVPAVPGVRRTPLGRDRLVLFQPAGASAKGPDLILSTYTPGPERIADRLARKGFRVRLAASAPVALAMARRAGVPAAVPRSATRADLHTGERVSALPVRASVPLSLVTPLTTVRDLSLPIGSLPIGSLPIGSLPIRSLAPELAAELGLKD